MYVHNCKTTFVPDHVPDEAFKPLSKHFHCLKVFFCCWWGFLGYLFQKEGFSHGQIG